MTQHFNEALLRQYAASGLSRAEAAANLGCSYAALAEFSRKQNIGFVHGGRIRKAKPDARAFAMKEAYESGRTLQDIGDEYGMTRERVRQIITKYFGCLSRVGGISVKGRATKAAIVAAKEARCLKVWGCSRMNYARVRRVHGYKPFKAFMEQRKNSKFRRIGWELTFWQWWTIWQKSGKWERRGRARTAFVMCRNGDVGPYAEGNVYIAPAFLNIHEGNSESDLPVGVRLTKSGRFYAESCGKRLGMFDTPEDAHLAYLKSLSQVAA